MTITQVVRGPLLNPRPSGAVEYFPDGVLAGDERGKIVFAGEWSAVSPRLGEAVNLARPSAGLILPPMLDAHIHIPQHPIRGGFLAGVSGNPEGGPLLAGLNKNVFPAEGKCADPAIARQVIKTFRDDTLAHGVVGGAAYMTVHASATREALETLGDAWGVGLVMMERNCPEYLRTDDKHFERDVALLAGDFGRRLIVTDRFAGAVDSELRQRGAALARQFDLRMQTHLNEQWAEKAWTESLYPEAESYTDVYRRDGLLERSPLMAHCIRMRPEEFDLFVAALGTAIVHCPVSNTLLGSGVMPLDEVIARRIPYAICTDAGASPTTSLLVEMVQFLRVHQGRSRFATPQEAVFRTTLAPAEILGYSDRLGSFDVGKELSLVEVELPEGFQATTADEAILGGLLETSPADLRRYEAGGEFDPIMRRLVATGLDVGVELATLTADMEATARRLDTKVRRVTLAGRVVFQR